MISDPLSELRELTPSRAMGWIELHAVAEQQATRLLFLNRIIEPPVPARVITGLGGLEVWFEPDLPVSGLTAHIAGRWHITLNAGEPETRQRFTLAHELKHVIDDANVRAMYAHLPAHEAEQRAELVCDFFAACLLMPRSWLKRDWGNGLQNPARLARRYDVSEHALRNRLQTLGLTARTRGTEQSPQLLADHVRKAA